MPTSFLPDPGRRMAVTHKNRAKFAINPCRMFVISTVFGQNPRNYFLANFWSRLDRLRIPFQ